GRWLPQLVEAFRTGDAPPPLPWAPEGRADYNRAIFLNLLGTQWLPAIADVHDRLSREPPARVADLACGPGWSSIAMARAYPLSRYAEEAGFHGVEVLPLETPAWRFYRLTR